MAVNKVLEVPKLLKDATNRQYLPDCQLGAGGFATCWRARMIDRRNTPEASQCALKAVMSAVPKNLVQRFRLELAIQSKLDHKHIVKLYRAFTFKDVTYVALELCPNGSLTDMMRRRKFLTMGEIRRILFQLCGAVKYLHDRDVVHRDIKAGNIFMDADMNIKLGDFGLAAIMEPAANMAEVQHLRRTTFCGTPNYLAPEILSRKEGHGTSVDIWAIGILAYYLAVGRAPFHSKSKEEIYAKLEKGEYGWPELSPEENEIPHDLRDLVGMILVEESRRPKTEDIITHPFFTAGFIPEKLDPLCRTRRPRFARVNDYQYCTGSCPPTVYCTCDASSRAYSQKRIYDTLSKESCIGAAHLAPSRPVKSVFLILADEISKKKKLEIPIVEGVVYTGQVEKFEWDPQQSATLPKIRRPKMEFREVIVESSRAVSRNEICARAVESEQEKLMARQAEKASMPVRQDEKENAAPRSIQQPLQQRISTPQPQLRQVAKGQISQIPEQEPEIKGTMRSRPRKAVPKFEIREDEGAAFVPERTVDTGRLRPLKSRIERGNRVAKDVEAYEKRRQAAA